MDEMVDPVRKRLEEELAAREGSAVGEGTQIRPVYDWDFRVSAEELQQGLGGNLLGTARLDGGLVLDGEGAYFSEPLSQDVGEKTLDVVVQLDGLEQRGGGALTIQGVGGSPFDSIVFNERKRGQWLAGSNQHRRTKDFPGASVEESQDPVRVTIVYQPDGVIRGYRNGKPYGESYRTERQEFSKGEAQVVIGLRHGTRVDGKRTLRGKVLQARVFDRALSEEEVRELRTTRGVSEKEVHAALSQEARRRWAELETEREKIGQALEALGESLEEEVAWEMLSHSLLNVKELIYLR
ncbi:MAG: LamG-like jellyroll fold domain-containing protein [Verrucomicrobiota bacterium]